MTVSTSKDTSSSWNPSPLVTIVIPSYNHAEWIENAIESALNQTYNNIELIIVDDCSTDKSKDVISKYREDPRIRIILKNKNEGQSHSINMALKIAQGEYISFLPSDDWYLPNKTSLQVEKFGSLPESTGVVYGRGQRFQEDTQKCVDIRLPMHKGNVLKALVSGGNFVYPVTPMFRRSALDQVVFDESYSAEGESVYIKLAKIIEFDYVDEVVGVMREHTYNTGSNYELMYADNVRWWNEFFQDRTLPEEVAKLENAALAKIHRMYGLTFITHRNNYIDGRRALAMALKKHPSYFFDVRVSGSFLLTFLPAALADKIVRWKHE